VPRDTLVDFFADLARARGEFLVHDDGFRTRRYTYEQVGRAAREFAGRLDDVGLARGDKVVFWCENRPEWIVAFWGCLLAGIVVVPVDYRASPEFLGRVARIVAARLVLVGQDVPATPIDGGVPIWKLHELDWDALPVAPGAGTADARQGRGPLPLIGRDDVAEIIFTSGATADPKGVVITHRNVLANIVPVEREVIKYRRWGRPFFPLRFLNLLPLSHLFGQAMATFIPPMLPGTVIFMRGYNPSDIITEIKTRRVSVLVAVPKILDVLRNHVLRVAPDAATPGPTRHIARRLWRYRHIHRLFGF
jgi:long-chain acyl-CoA synthetase